MTLAFSEELVGSSLSHSQSRLGSECSPSELGRPAISSRAATHPDERAARGKALAGRLHQFERLLKLASAMGGRLVAELAEETDAEGLAAITGHQMLLAFGNANVSVATALGQSAVGHRHLERLGRSLGYDVLAYGDGRKDPDFAGIPVMPSGG